MTDRGRLRTYLGTAPGVGKTYAMLTEGRRRAAAGERVAVGWVERHGRSDTRAQVGDLEVVPPRIVNYKGHEFSDLDLPGVIERQPDVVLVDELAHTVADGSRRRWEEIEELLAHGIDVVTTANVANLISTRDYVARITGAGTSESVPDEFVRSGDVVLVDLPAVALRQRIASGRVYSTDRVGGALAGYFAVSNLEALSELGRAWVDGSVDEVGGELLVRHGLEEVTPRRLVVAAVSDSPRGEQVIARGTDVALAEDADLLVVHVDTADGLRRHSEVLNRYRDLTTQAGGVFSEVSGAPVEALARIARDRRVERIIIGRRRSRLARVARGSVAAHLRRLLPDGEVEEVE